jgi:putative glutamine amidotransferase
LRKWTVWIRRTVLALVCLAIFSYAGLKIWQWASVAADAPVIGVSFDTAWHAQMGATTTSYRIGLTRAGAKIVELDVDDEPGEILDRIDGLLLAGGGDIDPALYGGDPQAAQLVDRKRDDFELALIRGACQRDMPILGICRGIQILNVSQGGTLRDLRHDAELSETHGIDLDSIDAHEVEIVDGSRLAQLLGPGTHRVNSFHGQAVNQVGQTAQAVARSPDGLVEAIELPGQSFVIGTQWHPEMPSQQMAVFEAFVEQAAAYGRR